MVPWSGARREAGSAFGDDTIFMERWLPACRHVEIQIMGDAHGNLVHCFERECSIQRRHQKVIEEAPSAGGLRRSARQNGCGRGGRRPGDRLHLAGTVEFLVDGDDFWFLEVNTRLQVEHPITEEITGLDLVREQLRVAEGAPLGFAQDDLSINGHAIEVRSTRKTRRRTSCHRRVRWSSGTFQLGNGALRLRHRVRQPESSARQFDPMLAKVIVHAPTGAKPRCAWRG